MSPSGLATSRSGREDSDVIVPALDLAAPTPYIAATRRGWRVSDAGKRRHCGKNPAKNSESRIDMADKQTSLQDLFLNALRKSKTPVTMFLVKGVKLQGIVTWFDNFSGAAAPRWPVAADLQARDFHDHALGPGRSSPRLSMRCGKPRPRTRSCRKFS